MRNGIYVLQTAAMVWLSVLMFISKRISLTGWWTVVVIGFIGMAGKWYDLLREQQSECTGSRRPKSND